MMCTVLIAYECEECFAWLPYWGCPHGCSSDIAEYTPTSRAHLLEFLDELSAADFVIYISVPDDGDDQGDQQC